MKIDENNSTSFLKNNHNNINTRIKGANEKSNINNSVTRKNISQITDYEKRGLPVSERVFINTIERANKALMGVDTRFEFSIHEQTKEIMVKIINNETNEVVKEIPPEKILDLVAKMWEMAGIIVDERR